ncbi:MAG: hypothetical protein KAR47_18540 [Planctomycetes bacterium]|nr:hypothetical protein [Planctomycetota bacterium]
MSQSDSTKPKGQRSKKLMLVRYGQMGGLGWFEHSEHEIPRTETRVVIKTERGLELGDVVGLFNYRGGQFRSSPEQVDAYLDTKGKDYPLTSGGTFVRFATREDVREEKHLQISAQDELKCAEKFVEDMQLPMKLISIEHLFGGERIIIYFSSAGRVDFRELVKRLAREYRTRIELRQIGSRDEARMMSDYESCGQECCCRRFLKVLEPVNMRMAKLQKATLDPSKISGHCGRLKCCLRYEDQTYQELKKKLPRKNALVKTSSGQGKVLNSQILTQLVVVGFESGKREAFGVDEIEILPPGTIPPQSKGQPDRRPNSADKPSGGGRNQGGRNQGGRGGRRRPDKGEAESGDKATAPKNASRNRSRNRGPNKRRSQGQTDRPAGDNKDADNKGDANNDAGGGNGAANTGAGGGNGSAGAGGNENVGGGGNGAANTGAGGSENAGAGGNGGADASNNGGGGDRQDNASGNQGEDKQKD